MTDSDLLYETDLCVKCGLCLPHCPTYSKTQNENESPRGRISLIQAWANGDLTATPKLLEHIDNCLLCRACERVCPANVNYGQLVDDFRSRIYKEKDSSFQLSLLKKIGQNTRLNRTAQSAVHFYQSSGLQKFARNTGLTKATGLNGIDRLLPDRIDSRSLEKEYYPARSKAKGEVGLFKGCMGDLLDFKTVSAAIRVLNHAGFNVHVPANQTCCGALELHSGNIAKSSLLAQGNFRAFADKPVDAILTIASGCGSTLKEYSLADTHNEFSGKIMDISQFLYQSDALADIKLEPLNANICLHSPCSLKNVMREEQGALQLISRIPGCKVTPLPDTVKCCGSAGSYMLEHPDMAQSLLDDLLISIDKQTADILVTSNIGCALHIQAGLRDRGIDLEVLHPVVLLERQLISDR